MGVRSVPPHGVDCSLKAKRDRVIALLTKVNDRDTHKRASEELHVLVSDKLWMDSDALLMLVHQLCIPTPVQKVFARKECAHILGMLASKQCPLQGLAVGGPTLQKIIMQLRRYMQDPDSPVRDAASEAAARVARGLWERGGGAGLGEAQGVGGGSTNPVGRMLLECLAEGKRELQAAACGALRQAAPYLGKVDTVMVREVIKRLNSPSFQAHPALLGALGQVDPMTGSVAGLIQSGGSVLHNHLPQLIGHPGASSGSAASSTTSSPTSFAAGGVHSPSTGLCACLSSKDWMTRKGASDCLRALFLVLGPLCEPEGAWDTSDVRSLTARCARVLDSARFDKVREVREAAREAVALLEVLRAYSTGGGGGAGGWDAHARRAMAARGSANLSDVPFAAAAPAAAIPAGLPRPRSSAQHQSRHIARVPEPSVSKSAARFSPPSSPDGKPSASRPSFSRTALATRFLGAHGNEDVIVESKPAKHRFRLSTGGEPALDRHSASSNPQSVTEPLPQVSRSASAGVPSATQQHSGMPEMEHSFMAGFPAENSYALDEHHKHEEEEPGGMDLTLFNANLGLRPGDAMQPLDINTWEGTAEQPQLGSPNGHGHQEQPFWAAPSEQQDVQGGAQQLGAPTYETSPPMYGSSLDHLQLDAPPQEPHPQEQQQQLQQEWSQYPPPPDQLPQGPPQQQQGHTTPPFPFSYQPLTHSSPPHSQSALAAPGGSTPSGPNSHASLGTEGSSMQAAPGPSTEESTSCSGQQQQPASPSRAAAQEPSAAALGHAASASPDHSRSRASSVDFGHGAGAAASSAAPEQGSFGEGQEQSSYSAGALPVPAVASDAGAVHGLAGSSSSKGFEQGEVISVPAAEWRGLQQRLQELEGRNRELEEAMAVLRAGSEHTVAELQSHIAHLEGTHGKQGDAWMQPSSPKRQAAVSLQGSACSADVNAMYAEALQHNTGPPHLLELMKHTGICWSDLQPQVAHQLLAAFATCAQFPEVLPKAMPWLWRLADEQQTPSHLQPRALPPGTRQNVLEGLAEAATSLECSHPSVSEETECQGGAAAADAAQPLERA